jgi:hypothetical protein
MLAEWCGAFQHAVFSAQIEDSALKPSACYKHVTATAAEDAYNEGGVNRLRARHRPGETLPIQGPYSRGGGSHERTW